MSIRIELSDESRTFSQHGEDGVIERITSVLAGRIPTTFLELGAHPRESNTLALRERGWSGVMIDEAGGDGIVAARITRENINELIRGHFVWERCGVLSVDLDGNDYWIVEAITELEPAVIVVEYNAAFDAVVKLATPYREPREWSGGCDYSASLGAWTSLLLRKWGARLCYIESTACNAFFVRAPVAAWLLDLSRPPTQLMPTPHYSYGNPLDWEWQDLS